MDRLPACDKWHPNVPSKFSARGAGSPGHPPSQQVRKKGRNCSVCSTAMARARRAPPRPQTYGVIRLPWLDTAPGLPYVYVGGLELGEFTQRQ